MLNKILQYYESKDPIIKLLSPLIIFNLVLTMTYFMRIMLHDILYYFYRYSRTWEYISVKINLACDVLVMAFFIIGYYWGRCLLQKRAIERWKLEQKDHLAKGIEILRKGMMSPSDPLKDMGYHYPY